MTYGYYKCIITYFVEVRDRFVPSSTASPMTGLDAKVVAEARGRLSEARYSVIVV